VGQKDEDGKGWASSKDHVVADPATMRGYGQNIAKLRFDFQADVLQVGMGLRGIGRDDAISTGMYEPGQTCNALVDNNGQEVVAALNDFLISLTAIPAAALTMADLFDGLVARGAAMINAQCDAMLWAFATPGATRPPGAPPYIKGTIKGKMAKYAKESEGGKGGAAGDKFLRGGHYSGADVEVYRTANGETRYVIRTAGGGYTEWAEDDKGNRSYLTVQEGNGPVVTTNYAKNGDVESVTKRYKPTITQLDAPEEKGVTGLHDERQLVETYKDGKKTTTTDHLEVKKYSDGTESHTYSTEENGKRTEEGTVGRQPPATNPDTWSDLGRRQGRALEEKARGL
jgi:hypothetical protein